MLKQKWISTTLALSLTVGTAYTAFAQVAAAAEQTAQATQAQTVFQYTTDVSVQANQLAAFEAIKALFTDKPDLAKIQAQYEKDFKAAVVARNAAINEEISFMLAEGIKGTVASGQVKQAIDKGLQWFFYDEINAFNGEARTALAAGDKQKAKAALDKAIRLFEGTIYVTAGKRDTDFGTGMQDFLKTVVVPGLQKAVEEGDNTNFNVYRQYFHKTMMKVFVLATSKYAAAVEKGHKEGTDVKVQMTEGYFFFMPIHTYMAGGNKEAADAIREVLRSGDSSLVKGDQVKSQLVQAATAKVNEYAGKAFANLAKGDKSGALIYAAEGNAFASQLEVIVEERLGADAYAAIEKHGQAYAEALQADKTDLAQQEAFAVLESLSQLNGVKLNLKDKSVKVNGQPSSNAEAVFYLDQKSNRTLASVSIISNWLGAKVDWVAAEKKVVLTKGDKTVELAIGSKDVVVNGKKDEKIVLDQPAVIKDGRTYIPVRAAAELVGGKVFYSNGEIIIN